MPAIDNLSDFQSYKMLFVGQPVKKDSIELTLFAWRGFRIEAPLDWELGAFDGDQANGYLRLDDLLMPRLEIRWSRSARHSPIDQTAKRYLERLGRTGGKSGSGQSSTFRPLNISVAWPDGLEVRCYRRKGAVEGITAVVQCSECERVSLVQIFFPPGEFSKVICKQILGSFFDHNPPDCAYWDFYLLHIRTPRSWKLLSQKFNPGYAELNFSGPGKLQIDFRRWGPASVLLKGKDLEQWSRENWPKGLKADSVQNFNRNGESYQVAMRNSSGLLAPLQRVIGSGPGIRKALCWHSTAWHCVASERVWMVDVFARGGPEAAEAKWQVLCHQSTSI